MRFLIITILLLVGGQQLMAQFNTNRLGNMGGGGGGGKMTRDTGRHEEEPDTLTLTYRYLGEPTDFTIDSSIADFNMQYLKVPRSYMTTGNSGGAARNLIFTPFMKAGFDAGFHAYDVYGLTHADARFYNTTRPYTEMNYLVGSKQEQIIGVQHTQNRTNRFNFAFDYRKVNAPGYYKSQTTNHNTYRLSARYQSKNKRANSYMDLYHNNLQGGENGGIRSDSFLHNSNYSNRRTIPVNLGNDNSSSYNFFTTSIPVKSQYRQTGFLFQQQYDWGRGDTIHVNDTTDYYKYDPFFRVQYTFNYLNSKYEFTDGLPDTAFYPLHYNIPVRPQDSSVFARHQWQLLSNDLSLVQFPVRGNLGHFINVGARFESWQGTFLDADINFSNLALHGEYRNKTKNQLWDFSAKGEFYLAGQNIGDYSVGGMLRRHLNDLLGDIKLSVNNVNREPSYVYKYFNSNRTTWYNESLNKENITQLQFAADNKKLKYNLAVNYFLFTNYTYMQDYYHSAQYSSLFNLLQVVFSKKFTFSPFSWYVDLAFQQVHGEGPMNVPAFWTRNRLAYEKRLFTNLNLMTGIEVRYNTAYYADDYSPLMGQWVYQQSQKIKYQAPDLDAFVHFRIKSFNAFVRAENLNTLFATSNYAAPLYPYNNFDFRLGIRWWFIN
ncbi:Putative porin [Chitinophaga jiangningensis]|uniref:Putative porin n=1 Tax=Chitinophaga jiangningensis TaxID=1419482 RepID=A0A1M6VIU8_9BACT|nr:putative porin [Chitinophaga jiangningensis]SHK81176.1 Putative porin [Chitinophaga jiangningensis]